MQHDVIPDAPPLRTRDGLQLHWVDWPVPQPVGAVLLVHGLGEHIGRYQDAAERLNSWGWSVSGYDHRGHGRSPGQRGGLVRDDDLLVDLAFAIDRVRARRRELPLVVLGHSMGGLVASCLGASLAEPPATRPDWSRSVDGLVLSSPALDAGLNPFQKFLLKTIGSATPDLAVPNGLKLEHLCRDPEVVRAYEADPLVHGVITGRLARFIATTGPQVVQRASAWRVPTLLAYASTERILDPRGSDRFAQQAPRGVVSTRAFPAMAHEILLDPEKDEVFDLIRGWLEALRGATSAAELPAQHLAHR